VEINLMVTVTVRRELYRMLYERTPQIAGPFMDNDLREFKLEMPDEAYARLMEFAEPGEDVSDAIERLCNLHDLMFGSIKR
jgi:predicted CopG family antitoxin